MVYLQKVIALVESEKCVSELEKLGQTLHKEGLEFQCFVGEHVLDSRPVINYAGSGKNEPCLWMTDNAIHAVSLKTEKEPVVAILHEDNRNQDFSGVLYACEEPGDLDVDYLEKVYRRCVGLPWDIAETDRCIVRESAEADVEEFFKIYEDPEITRYTEGLYPTVEQEKQYIRDYIEKVYGFYGYGVWTVLKKDTGEIIGRIGFSCREGYEEPEIGFVIGVPWQKQGYAEEVCKVLLEYAREELEFEEVQAFVMQGNDASIGLCEKLGLHKTGMVNIKDIDYERFYKKF